MLTIVGNQQFNIGFPLWSDKHMDLMMFGWQVPVDLAAGGRRRRQQRHDAAVDRVLELVEQAPRRARRADEDGDRLADRGRRPGADGRSPAGIVDTTHGKVGPIWTLAYTIVNDIGFANILPVGLALYSRVAPKQIVGLVIGIYYLHLFVGNSFVGWLAGFMDSDAQPRFLGRCTRCWSRSAACCCWSRASLFGYLLSPAAMQAEAQRARRPRSSARARALTRASRARTRGRVACCLGDVATSPRKPAMPTSAAIRCTPC